MSMTHAQKYVIIVHANTTVMPDKRCGLAPVAVAQLSCSKKWKSVIAEQSNYDFLGLKKCHLHKDRNCVSTYIHLSTQGYFIFKYCSVYTPLLPMALRSSVSFLLLMWALNLPFCCSPPPHFLLLSWCLFLFVKKCTLCWRYVGTG